MTGSKDETKDELLVVYGGKPGEGLIFAPDGSGWAAYRTGQAAPRLLTVFARFGRVKPDPRFVVRRLLLESGAVDSKTSESPLYVPGGIDARDLRSVPLGRLTAAVNRPGEYERVAALLQDHEAESMPFPEDLWTAEGWPWWVYAPAKPRSPRLKVKVPAGHRKPDSFYQKIGERFAYLSVVSERPATELAEANGVPTTTIHGWVREARRRGLMGPSERGTRERRP